MVIKKLQILQFYAQLPVYSATSNKVAVKSCLENVLRTEGKSHTDINASRFLNMV